MQWLFSFMEGLGLGASLIVAIGAQNAYVLQLGLRREFVFVAASFCAAADLVLIAAGVFGLGVLVEKQTWFLELMRWGGAGFLAWYGFAAGRRSLHPGSLKASEGEVPLQLTSVVATLAAFTFLNPHVYLDTVLLLGGLGARHSPADQTWFVGGAGLASMLWFFGLAYGSRFLAPLFRRASTWRVLDGVICLVMFGLAASLVLGGFGLP